MAGTYTHWMVVEDAITRCKARGLAHDYFGIISEGCKDYLLLGAVGPDLPYYFNWENRVLQRTNWSDRMHYENISGFVKKGISNLDGLDGEAFDKPLAFLCGYATHIIADTMIHPVVNSIVGPYMFNRQTHMDCEVVQDSLIFEAVNQNELMHSDYENFIERCKMGDIEGFWSKTLKQNHPDCNDEIRMGDWKENFQKIMYLGKGFSIYRKVEDIPGGEKDRFYLNAKLPGNRNGNFKTAAFDRAVDETVNVWMRLFDDIRNKTPENVSGYIKNWNLDSGADMDEAHFW